MQLHRGWMKDGWPCRFMTHHSTYIRWHICLCHCWADASHNERTWSDSLVDPVRIGYLTHIIKLLCCFVMCTGVISMFFFTEQLIYNFVINFAKNSKLRARVGTHYPLFEWTATEITYVTTSFDALKIIVSTTSDREIWVYTPIFRSILATCSATKCT